MSDIAHDFLILGFIMVEFTKCLERGEVVFSAFYGNKLSVNRLLRRLAMGSKMKRFKGKGIWEFRFYGFDSETEDMGEDERFALVEKFDWKNIRKNEDGTHTLVLNMHVWENKRLFNARKNENAICVPLELTFTPGKKSSWDSTRDILDALRRAEAIRAHRNKGLTLKPQGNGTTLVTAPDKSFTEVNTLVMEKAQELINEFGINVVSLDTDHVTCMHGGISYLNLHIDNPEALKMDGFEDKRYALTEFGNKYDWDVFFVAPSHARNPFIEYLNS